MENTKNKSSQASEQERERNEQQSRQQEATRVKVHSRSLGRIRSKRIRSANALDLYGALTLRSTAPMERR